ncbi:MAG: DNA polymerase III subunit alpha [Candidatus Izemoplasmataceae bacterium]
MVASLFLETAYSFNGSNITMDSLFGHARETGSRTLVLTDRRMHAAYKFYKRCQKANITPVLGVQVDAAPFFKETPLKLIVYAKNKNGYDNLMKLSTMNAVYGNLELTAIAEHIQDTSVVVNTLEGEMAELRKEAQESALKTITHEVFSLKTDAYLGVDPALDDPKDERLLPLDRTLYLTHEEHTVLDALCKIHETENRVEDGNDASFKSPSDLKALYKAPDKVLKFIDAHKLTLDLPEASLPGFPTPKGIASSRYLKALATKGLKRRIDGKRLNEEVYKKRLTKELETINALGYDDYFLIVWDVVRFAKQAGILVGPGRGSAPGSLVAYALGITSVDPVRHGLLFERFLNKARLNMPDIDIDFPDDKRDQVIQYTLKKYGNRYVSLICTFGTFLKRSSLRDTARIFDIQKPLVDEVVRTVKNYDSIQAMIDNDPDVKNRMDSSDNVGKWLNVAAKIEGIPRHVSTHAAGIILSDRPLIDYTPLQPGLNEVYQTQFEQSDLEAMGLLKMDFLGLRNLTMIENILQDIESAHGRSINLHKLPLDDPKTYRLLREKSTTGLFQLESAGMRSLIRRLQPRTFDDIAMALALYRPGPMESIPAFLKRRQNKEGIKSLAPEIDPILKPTQGILLYQEQIMALASRFAGYSLNEADILRRAVSKKDRDTLEKERLNFVDKSVGNGKDKRLANAIYDYIVRFADYGFNKSHSVAYGLVAYWMAYLKAHYPGEFLIELMHTALSNASQMRQYMQEALDLDLEVSKPDVRYSGVRFTKVRRTLYYPLSGVKNLGKKDAEAIVEARNKEGFTSFTDFVRKTVHSLNRRHYEFLIHAGALDGFEGHRRMMVENLDAVITFAKYESAIDSDDFMMSEVEPYDYETLRRQEFQALGLNIEFDRLKPYESLMEQKAIRLPKDSESLPLNRNITMLGVVNHVKEIQTKKGDTMAFITLEDRITTLDGVCFPNAYGRLKSPPSEGDVLLFKGVIRLRDDARQLVIENIVKPSV